MLTLSLVNSPQSITHRFVKRSRLCGAEKSIKIKIVFLGRSQKQKILGPPTDIYIYTAKKCCVFKMFNLQFPLRGILGILSIFLWSKRASRQDRDTHCINTLCVCVCVFFPSILDIKFVGRTSRGHTGGRSHRIFNPPSRALIFIARRIQPFLSLVDREVEFCVLTI